MRESPAYEIVKRLEQANIGELLICEPNLSTHKDIPLVSLDAAITGADIIVVLVDHKSFKKLNASDLREKVVIDTRGIIK